MSLGHSEKQYRVRSSRQRSLHAFQRERPRSIISASSLVARARICEKLEEVDEMSLGEVQTYALLKPSSIYACVSNLNRRRGHPPNEYTRQMNSLCRAESMNRTSISKSHFQSKCCM